MQVICSGQREYILLRFLRKGPDEAASKREYPSCVQALRKGGNDVLWIREEAPGITDIEVMKLAHENSNHFHIWIICIVELKFRP
jgi:hypothetical protein